MTKPKAEWRSIDIPGQREAFVAIVQGREIGTIARQSGKSAWTVQAGIGAASRLITTCFNKEEAKFRLLTAPESFWRASAADLENDTAARTPDHLLSKFEREDVPEIAARNREMDRTRQVGDAGESYDGD